MSRNEHFRNGLGDFNPPKSAPKKNAFKWVSAEDIPVTGTVHLPPTPEAIEHIHRAESDQRLQDFSDEVGRKDQAIKSARARNGPYGAGGKVATQRHLMKSHGAWREDVEEHDPSDLARWHESWHKDERNWGSEEHTHGQV